MKSRTWLRRAWRALLALLLLLTLGLAGLGAFAWERAHQALRPSGYRPPQALLAYADEPAPVPHPLAAATSFDWDRIASPPRTAMPWIRWWWPGADVDAEELERELRQLHDAGFGGAEIQPFAAGVTEIIGSDEALRARVYAVDTQAFQANLRSAVGTARALGLQIDLTHYSGWPGGSPAAAAADGLQNMVWSEAAFDGGGPVEIALPPPSPRINALAGGLLGAVAKLNFAEFDPAAAHLLSVIVARPLRGSVGLLPVGGPLQLDPGSIRVVDADVHDGKLGWDAPPGRWVLVASWLMPSGQRPVGAAFPVPAYAVNPLDATRVRAEYNYIFGQRSGLAGFYGDPLHAIFNDSLEFTVDRLGAADILAEFHQRRGYDLRPLLPAVYLDAADNTYFGKRLADRPPFAIADTDARVRYDYQQTLSELMIERFYQASSGWAHAHGLLSRAQPYGFDMDVIRAEGVCDIPETEQLESRGAASFLKAASSAALLYGRRIVSAESLGFAGAEYTTNPAKMKASADLLFVNGVNQLVYHGFPYDWKPAAAAEPLGPQGWHPFGSGALTFSENYSPRVPLWADMAPFNAYVARAQNLLRQGQPQADVLIYYPAFGIATPLLPAAAPEPLQDGHFPLTDPASGFASLIATVPDRDPLVQWLTRIKPLLDQLDRHGLTWQWVNGDGLRNQLQADGRTRAGAPFGALLFAETTAAPPEDLAAAQRLSAAGIPVLFYGSTPDRQPGYLDAAAGDARVHDAVLRLLQGRPPAADPQALADTLMARQRTAVRYAGSSDIRRIGRVLDGGGIDFFANLHDAPRQVDLQMPGGTELWWFDAMSGAAAPLRAPADGRLTLTLRPYESRFLIAGVRMPASLPDVASSMLSFTTAGKAWPVNHWELQAGKVHRSGPLFDWRSDQGLRYSGETGLYRASLGPLHPEAGAKYLLHLGLIPGLASVWVNGNPAGRASLPPGDVDVTALLREGENQLEIAYVPPPRNAQIGLALAGDKRFAGLKSRSETVVPAGLISPVSLIQLQPVR